MKFNVESFEKALKANRIVKYQRHFQAVVKSYLEIENEQCNIADVVEQSEQFCECDGVQDLIAGTGECRKCGKECTY